MTIAQLIKQLLLVHNQQMEIKEVLIVGEEIYLRKAEKKK